MRVKMRVKMKSENEGENESENKSENEGENKNENEGENESDSRIKKQFLEKFFAVMKGAEYNWKLDKSDTNNKLQVLEESIAELNHIILFSVYTKPSPLSQKIQVG
ncbi:16919_t:CDS:2, partial [Gigaspora margarita]